MQLKSGFGLIGDNYSTALPGYTPMNSAWGLVSWIVQLAERHISTGAKLERANLWEKRTSINRGISSSIVVLLLLYAGKSVAAADWPTFGGDPQRSGSVEDSLLSPAKAADLELKWSVQVDNVPLALNSLMAPVVANNSPYVPRQQDGGIYRWVFGHFFCA